jgi:hypothetical protein
MQTSSPGTTDVREREEKNLCLANCGRTVLLDVPETKIETGVAKVPV